MPRMTVQPQLSRNVHAAMKLMHNLVLYDPSLISLQPQYYVAPNKI